MISVSALSAYVRCPRQFFVHYVLKEALPPKDVIILGLIKHKVYEQISASEESIVCSLSPDSDVNTVLRQRFVKFLRDAVRSYSSSLRQVKLPLVDAFQKCIPAVDFEVKDRASKVIPLLHKGLFGEDLYDELIPKVKPEYVVKSESLGLSGRIDRLECFPGCIVPVELKSGKPPGEGVWEAHRMQIACYMLMLSEKFGFDVGKGVVHYVDANVRREVVFNPFLKEWVFDTKRACKALIESRIPPRGCGREYCEYCNRKL